jgi:hypothetical protein
VEIADANAQQVEESERIYATYEQQVDAQVLIL